MLLGLSQKFQEPKPSENLSKCISHEDLGAATKEESYNLQLLDDEVDLVGEFFFYHQESSPPIGNLYLTKMDLMRKFPREIACHTLIPLMSEGHFLISSHLELCDRGIVTLRKGIFLRMVVILV
jgi:hypothetical protein